MEPQPRYFVMRWRVDLYDVPAALQDAGHLQAMAHRVTAGSARPAYGDRVVVLTTRDPATGALGDFVAAGRTISDVFPMTPARRQWMDDGFILQGALADPPAGVLLCLHPLPVGRPELQELRDQLMFRRQTMTLITQAQYEAIVGGQQ